MRGEDQQQQAMFSYLSPEARVPKDHPLRPIRIMVDNALADLAPLFQEMYSHTGRPSIPPEQLLRALLLQVLYTVRSERMLVEQLDYNLLFRWFVGLSMDDKVWDHTTFSKNKGHVKLCNINKNINNIFVITKLTLVFDVAETREEAIKAFGGE